MADPFTLHILKTFPGNSGDRLLESRVDEIYGMLSAYKRRHNPRTSLPGDFRWRDHRLFSLHTNSHADGVVSVFGGRGSGKTTLLLYVCSRLLHENIKGVHRYIVLPPILPERFGPHETMAGWMLAYLRMYVENNPKQARHPLRWPIRAEDPGAGRDHLLDEESAITVLEMVDFLREQESLLDPRFAQGLAQQNLWTAEYSQEATKLLDAEVQFIHHWDYLLEGLFDSLDQDFRPLPPHEREQEREREDERERENRTARRPLLVVTIDDADLNPMALPRIIHQLRLLAHPNVAFLFSADRNTLDQTMMIRELDGYGELDNNNSSACRRFMVDRNQIGFDQLWQFVNVRLLKALPKHNMLDIPLLSERERLEFVPIAGREGLSVPRPAFIELLEKFHSGRNQSHPFMHSLADYFELSRRVAAGCCPREWPGDSQTPPCQYRSDQKTYPETCPYAGADDRPPAGAYPDGCLRLTCRLAGTSPGKEGFRREPVPSPTAIMLPNAVRGMEQLYWKIESLAENLDGLAADAPLRRELFARAAKALITVSMDYYSNRLTLETPVVFEDAEKPGPATASSRVFPIRIDLAGVRFRTNASHPLPLPFGRSGAREENELSIYRIEPATSVVEAAGPAADKGKASDHVHNPGLTQALLFAVDLSGKRQVFDVDAGEDFVEIAAECWDSRQAANFCRYERGSPGSGIRSFFWLVPEWPKNTDRNVFARGWEMLRQTIVHPSTMVRGPKLADWFWDRHLLLVSCIQAGRCVPPDEAFEPSAADGDDRYWNHALDNLARLYELALSGRAKGQGSPRRNAFIRWFRRGLPLLALHFHYGDKRGAELLAKWILARLSSGIDKSLYDVLEQIANERNDSPRTGDDWDPLVFLNTVDAAAGAKGSGEHVRGNKNKSSGTDLRKAVKIHIARLQKENGLNRGYDSDDRIEYFRIFQTQIAGLNDKEQRRIGGCLSLMPRYNLEFWVQYFGQKFDNEVASLFRQLCRCSIPGAVAILDQIARLQPESLSAARTSGFMAEAAETLVAEYGAGKKTKGGVLVSTISHTVAVTQRLIDLLYHEYRTTLLSRVLPDSPVAFPARFTGRTMSRIYAETFRENHRRSAMEWSDPGNPSSEDVMRKTTALLNEWDTGFRVIVERLGAALKLLQDCKLGGATVAEVLKAKKIDVDLYMMGDLLVSIIRRYGER